jgi:hypothetical protein
MDVKDYCSNMAAELTGWKSKIDEALRKADTLPPDEKKKAAPVISNVQGIMSDLVARVHNLETRCPLDWSADKIEIEARLGDMKAKWNEIWGTESSARPLI